jgi:hypothetical protein
MHSKYSLGGKSKSQSAYNFFRERMNTLKEFRVFRPSERDANDQFGLLIL